MIEILKDTKSAHSHNLYLDGEIVSHSDFKFIYKSERTRTLVTGLIVTSKNLRVLLSNYSIDEISGSFESIEFEEEALEHEDRLFYITKEHILLNEGVSWFLYFSIRFMKENLTSDLTYNEEEINQYIFLLKEEVVDLGDFAEYVETNTAFSIHFALIITRLDVPLAALFKDIHEKVVIAIESVAKEIIKKRNPKLLSFSFVFPDEVRVPCEQYLLYFGDFLQELGINNTTNLNHEAGRALFTVKPQNEDEALERIAEALRLFLKIPSSPIVASSDLNQDPLFRQFQSEILRLQDRLLTAGDRLQAKEDSLLALRAGIELQQGIIQRQQGEIDELASLQEKRRMIQNGEILSYSLESMSPAPLPAKDEEEIIKGVALKKYEIGIFVIDAPYYLRWVKELLLPQKDNMSEG